jgi:hypothetical protein
MKCEPDSVRTFGAHGGELLISTPSPGGQTTFTLTVEQAARLGSDRNAVLAEIWGVSKSDYISWAASEFNVYCASATATGRQCRNLVAGGSGVKASKWVEMQGMKCHRHAER